jgi:hypothetical protein
MNDSSSNTESFDYRLFRFILFAGATLFIFIRSGPAFEGTSELWNPISFFQLFEGPLPTTYLNTIKWMWLITALLASINWGFSFTSKLALILGSLFIGYEYNFGKVHHSTQVYMGALFIMSFAPRFKKERSWHLHLVRLWVVYVMLTTGMQKLYYGGGLDWAFSDSFFLKIYTLPYHTVAAQFLLDSPVFISQLAAIFALVIVELLAPLSLTSKKMGILYFFIWTSFHPLVTLVFGRHYQFYSQIFVYAAFLPFSSLIPKKIRHYLQSP